MKNKLVLIVVSLLVSILLAACGGTNTSTEVTPNSGSSNSGGIVPVYTPPAGGINYIIAAGVVDTVNNTKVLPNNQLSIEANYGAVDMLWRLIERHKQGQPAIAALADLSANQAFNGDLEEVNGEHPQLRAVSYLSGTAHHIVVKADSDIHSFADLKGKRVGTSVPGEAMYYYVNGLLEEVYGISPSDFQGIPLGFAEVQDGLKNGSIDAGLIMGQPPSPLVLELAQTEDIRVLSVDPKDMETFLENKPYFSSVTVPAGTYPGQDDEITLGTFHSIFLTHEDTADEIVYQFLQTIIDNQEILKGVHPTFNINTDNMSSGVSIPFHSAAIKFFEDNGISYE